MEVAKEVAKMGIINEETLECAWVTVDRYGLVDVNGKGATYTVSAKHPSEIGTQPVPDIPVVYIAKTYEKLCGYLRGYGLQPPTRGELQPTHEEIAEDAEVVRKVLGASGEATV